MTDPGAAVSAGSLEWLQLFWPQPLSEATALGLLRYLAVLTYAPQLIWKRGADDRGVEYLIGCQLRNGGAVPCAVEQLVDGIHRHRL